MNDNYRTRTTTTRPRHGASFSLSTWLSTTIDKGAFQFGIRMAVMLTFTSLFVLIRTPSWHYPDGMWVLVSTLFVCWFPALDAASVMEKIVQRLIGTFVGAVLGLSCGFASLLLLSNNNSNNNNNNTSNPSISQTIFIACCMFLFCFLIVFLAGQCKVGRVKVIRRFAYATICKSTACRCCCVGSGLSCCCRLRMERSFRFCVCW